MFQAKKLLQGCYEVFGRTMEQNSQEDAEMLEEINGVLKQARILLVEHLVLKALGAYQHDKATGKDKINAHIRTLGPGNLKSTDLHKGLWQMTLNATKNQDI